MLCSYVYSMATMQYEYITYTWSVRATKDTRSLHGGIYPCSPFSLLRTTRALDL
jgi:hypothetical protein